MQKITNKTFSASDFPAIALVAGHGGFKMNFKRDLDGKEINTFLKYA